MSIPNQPVNPFSAHAKQEVDSQQPGPVYQGYPQNDQSFHQGMTCQSKKPRSAAFGFATFFVVIGFVGSSELSVGDRVLSGGCG